MCVPHCPVTIILEPWGQDGGNAVSRDPAQENEPICAQSWTSRPLSKYPRNVLARVVLSHDNPLLLHKYDRCWERMDCVGKNETHCFGSWWERVYVLFAPSLGSLGTRLGEKLGFLHHRIQWDWSWGNGRSQTSARTKTTQSKHTVKQTWNHYFLTANFPGMLAF